MTDEITSRSVKPKPVFSILVPSYNPAPFFETTMRSALDQMGPEDEILIQDAGSTDGTQDLIEKFQASDSRVKAVIEPDLGQSDALNKALARAKPSWTIWLNSDDVLVPGALDALREAIVAHPDADLFYGACKLLRVDGTTVEAYDGKPMTKRGLLLGGITSFSGSIVMPADVWRELGGLRTELQCAMDFEFQFRIAESQLKQQHVPVAIGCLRFHEGSKSANRWKEFVAESFRSRMEYANTPMEKLYGLAGAAAMLAVIPGFRFRLSQQYRTVKRRRLAYMR
jgi:GT2 family glycosyltransferase